MSVLNCTIVVDQYIQPTLSVAEQQARGRRPASALANRGYFYSLFAIEISSLSYESFILRPVGLEVGIPPHYLLPDTLFSSLHPNHQPLLKQRIQTFPIHIHCHSICNRKYCTFFAVFNGLAPQPHSYQTHSIVS